MNDNETHEHENGVRIYKSHLPSKVFEPKTRIAAFLGKRGVKHFQNPHIVQGPMVTMDSLVEAADRPIFENGSIRNVFAATYSKKKYQQCIEILQSTGFNVVYQEDKLEGQPDGMIWACLGGEVQ